MSPHPLRVLIAGGGIGGLCLAQGLHKAGIDVAVFERAASPDAFKEGYRIHLDPDGSRALHACLPEDRFALFHAACGRPPRSFAFLTERLDELVAIDVVVPGAAPDPVAAHRSINRYTLRQILLQGLDDQVAFGKELLRYERHDDHLVTAHFTDGTDATGSVLVGAEGTHSRVRAQLLPHPGRTDTGVVSIGNRVPLDPSVRELLPRHLAAGPAMILAPGGVNMFLATHEHETSAVSVPDHLLPPGRADYLVWAISARRDTLPGPAVETLPPERLHELAMSLTRAWDNRIRRIVAGSTPATSTATAIRSASPVPPWPAGNVTVLGDAIHSMPPSRGIGANTALRDASLLCHNLIEAGRHGDPIAAIADYERQMREYGFAAVKASMQALQQSVTVNPVAFAAFKAGLRSFNAALRLKKLTSS